MDILQKVKDKVANEEKKSGSSQPKEKIPSEFFSLILDTIPTPVTYITKDQHYHYVNKAFADWFGISPNDVIGKSVKEFLGEEAFAIIKPYMDKALNGETVQYEVNVSYKQLGNRFIDATYTPQFGSDGKVQGYIAQIKDVTEKVQTQSQLRKKQLELEDYVNNATVGLHWVDNEGIIIWANKAELDLLGYTPEEYIGQPIQKFHANKKAIDDILCKLQNKETLQEYEADLICKDGSLRTVLINSNVLWEDGKFVHTRCFTTDITERKKLFASLQQSEQRARLAVESAMVGIWEYDLRTQEIIWTDECKKIYGLPTHFSISRDFLQGFNHPDDQEFITHELRRIMESEHNSSSDFIYRIFRYSDQAIRFIRSKGKVLYENDLPCKFIGTIEDVTDEKTADESKARLAAIVESTDDAIISKTLDGIITSWNAAAERLYGYTAEEIIGKSILTIIPEDRLSEEDEIITRIRNGVPVEHYETKRKTRDGKLVDVSLTISPVRDGSGKIIGASKIARDITAQKLLLEELRENEERLRMAIETTKLGTWEYYPISKDLNCSKECKKIFGLPEDFEPTNDFVYEHTFSEDREFVKHEIRKAISPGSNGSCEIEYRILRNDGEIRWVKAQGKTFFNSENLPTRFIGTMADITDEKLHEQELRDSVEMFQTMADNVPAMIWMSGDDKFEDYFNKTWLKFRGRTLDEETDEGWLDGVHPDDVQKCVDTYNESFKQQKGFYTEYRLRRNDGEYRWISDNSVPRFSPDGEFLGFISACMDIDDQKRYREKIQDSELLFKTISNASPAALWMTDADQQNVFVSDTWLKWTGKTFEEVIDRGWLQSIAEEDRIITAEKFDESFATRKYFHAEFRFVRKDGEVRWGLTEGYPFYDTNGAFAGYAGSITDITEIKKLEQRKDDFIKMASHELKTPITSINGYVQLLMNIYHEMDDKKLQLSKTTVKSSLSTISKQVTKLTRLISELLDLSKIESGKLELNRSEFDLTDLVEETVRDVRLTTSKHAIVVNSEFNGKIYGDKDRIAQVMMNLLTNAIKYSPDANQVDVTVDSENKQAVIQVKDHGIGIDKKFHQKIFERFYRVEGKSEQTYPGFGIGLFIASEIVHRHSGTISVESERGKGSVFTVRLPLAEN